MFARRSLVAASLVALVSGLVASCSGSSADRGAVPKPATAPPTAMASASAKPAPTAAPEAKPSAVDRLATLKQGNACVLSNVVPPLAARPGAKAFEAIEPHCKGDMFCDTVDDPPAGADACFVANKNIQSAERKARSSNGRNAAASVAWDGMRAPKYLDRIDAHFHLTSREGEILRKNGFVVLDRLGYADYAHAFHDIFQEELPLYVGVDPILHAVFRGTEVVLGRVEHKRLAPALTSMLSKLRKTLASSGKTLDEATRNDLDVYLAVAASLAGVPEDKGGSGSLFGQDALIRSILDMASSRALQPVDLFGRSRMIDFSAFEPRGHYASGALDWDPSAYFQAVMWLSRLEWNLVSRGSRSSHPEATPDPRETPREARDALALADLVRRSGVLGELQAFEEVYSAFGGRREDVSVPDLLALMAKGKISPADAEAPGKLKTAIGDGFRRTARVHFMPQGVQDLPVIATLLGPRVIPDIAPLTRLVHDKIAGRETLGSGDVGYLLGHDRAASLLRADLEKYPQLRAALDAGRKDLAAEAERGRDVASSFLRAILSLASTPEGVRPSFMARDAYADLRLGSALVGYAELRHTFVLLAGQGYDAYGCAIPDAYVEPLAPFYDALLAHVGGLRKLAGGGFAGLTRVLETLRAISRTELASGSPTEVQRTWLGMVAEYLPKGGFTGDSGEPPKWTGWYFDMFEDREVGATRASAFVADYFTLTNAGQVAYLGSDGPRLGVFVVDAGGEPRAMVGPVARGYEIHAPIEARLNDSAALTSPDRRSPWRESFAAQPLPEPTLGLAGRLFHCVDNGKLEERLILASDRSIGPVTVTLLDHHGDPLAPPLTQDVGDGVLRVFAFSFPDAVMTPDPRLPPWRRGASLRTPVEAFSVFIPDLARAGAGAGAYDYTTSPSVFFGKDFGAELFSMRPRGTEPFILGGTWKPVESAGAAPALDD